MHALYFNGGRLGPTEWPMIVNLVGVSRENPLIIKALKVSIYVDGNPTEIALTEFDTLEMVKDKAATSVKRELKGDTMDSQYNTISNLDDFILTTTDNRMLYFEGTKPPEPYFSHGDKSVSHLARSDNEKIQKYCICMHIGSAWNIQPILR